MSSLPLGTRARTGEICHEAGAYWADSTPPAVAAFVQGNRMTSHDGQNVVWELFFYI